MKHFLSFCFCFLIFMGSHAQVGTVYEGESPVGVINFSNDVPSTRYLTIQWISPYVQGLPASRMADNTTGVIICQLKAISSSPIQQSSFTILRNGSPYIPDSKFGAVQFDLVHSIYEVKVGLVEGENLIKVKVENAEGRKESEILKVTYRPAKPNLYVFSVGTSTDLKYTSKDAIDFANAFANQPIGETSLFNSIEVESLIGEAAVANEIIKKIEQFSMDSRTDALKENDLIILFFSSHGVMVSDQFYLQAADYRPGRYFSSAVGYREIMNILDGIPCKKLIFIDACFSGGAKSSPAEINEAVNILNLADGTSCFVSSSKNQKSWEDESWQNGAFTEAILQGLLEGKADEAEHGDNNKIVTIEELRRYVEESVPQMVGEVRGEIQEPRMINNQLGNIPIFLLD